MNGEYQVRGKTYRWTRGEYGGGYGHWVLDCGWRTSSHIPDWPAAKAALDELSEQESLDQPYWTHDSDCCTFLGGYIYGTQRFDLYWCAHGIPTVIARWSSEGPDYSSGLCFADVNAPLGEAKRRAEERGLIEQESALVGDGIHDDTAAIQRMADHGHLHLPPGTYRVLREVRSVAQEQNRYFELNDLKDTEGREDGE